MIWPYPLTEHFLIEMEPAYTRILSFFPVSGSEGIPTILTRRCTRIASPHSALDSILYNSNFNSRMYTDCKGHGINSRPCPSPCFPFREPHVRGPLTRCTQVRFTPYHGELLDLFFARLLPSGTGDFDAGPSQLREKQTNPIMLLPYPLTGCFFSLITWTSPGRVLLPSVPFLSSWYNGVRRPANGCLRVRFRSWSLRP